MLFSKSFGYALRSILYLAAAEERNRIQLSEVANELRIPRHFLGKVLKKLAKEGVLDSQKGPSGGFAINQTTLQTPLLKLVEMTGETEQFEACILRLGKCSAHNQCPLHNKAEQIKEQWHSLLSSTIIRELVEKKQPEFLRNLAVS